MSANNLGTVKRKAPPSAWKKGQSGNPKGAPKRGESWAELIEKLGDFDGPTAAEYAGFLSKQFGKLTAGVNLKTLVVLRVYAALIDDPQPGLLNAFMERVEGKVKDKLEVTGDEAAPLTVIIRYANSGSNPTGTTPSPDENQA